MRYESAFVVALLLFLPRIQKLNDFFFHLPRRIAAWKVFSQDVVFDSYGVLLTLLFLPQNIKRLFIGELTTLRHLL